MSPDEVQALTFDVFGTVVDWRGGYRARGTRRSWAGAASSLTGTRSPIAGARATSRRWRRCRSGRRPWAKLDDLHRENLLAVLDELGPRRAPREADLEHLNRAWHRLDPWPDAVAGLTRLKRRFILATLSNGNVALLVNMARHGGPAVGRDPRRRGRARLQATARGLSAHGRPTWGSHPPQCLMVAAHNGDLVAARACGFRTAFVARPTEHGPGQTRRSARRA